MRRLRRLFIATAACALSVLSATPAFAAPPPNADQSLAPWYHSLTTTGGGSCCGQADCRNFPVQPTAGGYLVQYDGKWLKVPPEAVSKRTDNPTGDYVACVQPELFMNGTPQGPQVLCFIRAPGA